MKKMKQYRSYITLFCFIIAALVVYKIIDNVSFWLSAVSTVVSVLLPFVYGFIIAFVLYIPVRKIESLLKIRENSAPARHARGISVAVVYIVALAILGATIFFAIPPLAKNLIELIGKLPAYYDNAVNYIKSFAVDGKIAGISVSVLDDFTLSKLLSELDMGAISTYAQGVFAFGSGVVRSCIAVIVSVYMLLSKESLTASVKRILFVFVPKKAAGVIEKYTLIICDTFYKYIYSLLLDALIVGAACVIAFSIVGVPYAVLLGIAVGVSNLIPYFGAIISGASVALITLMSGSPVKALIVIILIIVIQQIDGNIIQPKIVGVNVGIKPIYVLLAITVGGGLFGVGGMVVGVPVVAVLRTVLADVIQFKESRVLQRQEESAEDTTAE